jgi:hypothetical protein
MTHLCPNTMKCDDISIAPRFAAFGEVFRIRLPGLPLVNFDFLDAQRLVDPHGVVRTEHAATVTDQHLRDAIPADRGVC